MDKGVSCEHLNKIADVLGKELFRSKETLKCFDCGCPGPNLWICLQPECHHIGCSEVKNDHSTLHQKNFPSHCVHMNVSTERIWCYLCEKEVHIRAALAQARVNPDSTSMSQSAANALLNSVGLNAPPDEDYDVDDMDYDDETRPRGLVGLQNMGNTCYMNAALQALSNIQPFTSYFLECAAAVSVLSADKKPGLSRAYQKLIKDMWCKKTRGYLVPNGILYGIRNVHPMFRGYQQHDTQEFLRCFMDQLHEELKEPILDNSPEDRITSEADGDHQENKNVVYVRRRAASSGASDAPFFARMRRKLPGSLTYTDNRTDGYSRVSNQDSGNVSRHRRSASFAGTHQVSYVHTQHNLTSSADPAGVPGGAGGAGGTGGAGSESELSWSSEADERYETCSSGASDTPDVEHVKQSTACGSGDGGRGGVRYRSIISDVFDGKLLSSVQCLICNRVSTRVETFQDLSLPIPSREHLGVLRSQQPILNHQQTHGSQDSWVWWFLSWLRSWFYGPVVSLQDCLAAFFSADELKGDNMYSCSRCNKLRNGIKMSGVLRLPEVLCVHLKRFRHELMFSSKVAARVSFPIQDLNMAPYTHKECTSTVRRYELCAVISHAGTAGGGHYTCAARNARGWFAFDDHNVAPLAPHLLPHTEAYVLFYRKVNPLMTNLRQKAAELLESNNVDNCEIKYYISRQWINKFNTWAEPGPIDNGDFVCCHGGVRPDRVQYLHNLAAVIPQPLWDFLYENFKGGPSCVAAVECGACARAAQRLRARRALELNDFHYIFQEQERLRERPVYAISMHWFRQWQAFVRNKSQQPPPPIDNTGILAKQEIDGITTYILKQGSDHAQLSEDLWRFFVDIYGGGPEVRLKGPTLPIPHQQLNNNRDNKVVDNRRLSRKYSESDKEEYCTKSTSETNIRDTFRTELHKNQSLQNINRSYKVRKVTAESDDDVSYNHFSYKKQEPNGNYQDSDDEMDAIPQVHNTVRVENGVDSSDHDANDNPVYNTKNSNSDKETDMPNLDNITLKNKPSKTGKVRKMKKRTVK